MHNNLETFLDEISHFLSGREEREEILAEIRSHILEKAEQEAGRVDDAALDKVIAAYGEPRRVAEKYLDGRPLIAPALQRYLFRYASLLFAVHFAFVMFSVVFKRGISIFPFLYVPSLSIGDAIIYLPMAFLADFGAVALVLYFITRSGREIRLPWPKFASDLDDLQAPKAETLAARIANMIGSVILVALTAWAFRLYARFHTLFIFSSGPGKFKPLFMPAPGRTISLAALILLAAWTATLLIKMSFPSRRLARWVDAVADGVALVLIGVVLGQPQASLFAMDLPAKPMAWAHVTLTITLLVMALFIAIDLVTKVARLGRKRPAR